MGTFVNYTKFTIILSMLCFVISCTNSGGLSTISSSVQSLPKLSISIDKNTLTEGDGISANLKITRTNVLDTEIPIHLSLSGTADANDLVGFSADLILASGQTEQTVSFTTSDDSDYEGTENLTISLDSSSSYEISSDSSVTLTITDNDLPPVVSLKQTGGYTITEGNPAGVTLKWSIPNPIYKDLVVINTLNNIAAIGRHSTIPSSITIPKGSTSYSLLVTAIDDSIYNSSTFQSVGLATSNDYTADDTYNFAFFSVIDNELGFSVSLSDATASEAGPDPGAFRITKQGTSSSDLVVYYTIGGTATAGTDYTALTGSVTVPAASTYVDIPVTVKTDSLLEPVETVTMTLVPSADYGTSTYTATLSIQDNNKTVYNSSIYIRADVQDSPPQITLQLENEPSGLAYYIYRKQKDSTSWGNAIATLPTNTIQYVDTNVTLGESYEYKVDRQGNIGSGYISAGIKVPTVDSQGKVILIVDSSKVSAMATEIQTFVSDLEAEGWIVLRHDVSPTDTVTSVKNLIVTDYNQDSTNVKSVILLGRIPVPYSGALNPDGHSDHYGAWPADVYYGDIDGIWTDTTVNTTSASRTQNRNIPGDGKFDQSTLPSDLELSVGRIDLSNMTAFAPKTETDLLIQYLNKDHNFRKALVSVPRRALIDDNFGYFNGEAFATSSWSSYSEIVGTTQVTALDWFTTLPTNNYLFAHGNGGGTYTSASNVGSTTQFASTISNAVFTTLFGSYFGDWDSTDNFLRAPLANAGLGLSCAWSGRAKWFFHQMGLGETLGFSSKLSQNNSTLYPGNGSTRGVHMALMGDPTLKAFIVLPVSNVQVSQSGSDLQISWNASTDTVLGYNVYIRKSPDTAYTKVTTTMLASNITNYSYLNVSSGSYEVMIRAVKLEATQSGTFYNLSSGEKATIIVP